MRPFKLLLFLFLLLVFQSCEKDDEVKYIESKSSVKEVKIPDNATVNEKIMVNLIAYGASGCSSFSRFQTQKFNDTTEVLVFQKRSEGENCSHAIIDLPIDFNTQFDSPGKYYFRFENFHGGTLLDSIQIN